MDHTASTGPLETPVLLLDQQGLFWDGTQYAWGVILKMRTIVPKTTTVDAAVPGGAMGAPCERAASNALVRARGGTSTVGGQMGTRMNCRQNVYDRRQAVCSDPLKTVSRNARHKRRGQGAETKGDLPRQSGRLCAGKPGHAKSPLHQTVE